MKNLNAIKATVLCIAVSALANTVTAQGTNDQVATQLYFGDTHLHTSYSFDAFLNDNHSADPDTAYRWAKGQPVIHPYNRARVQIHTPLDFLVVSDHAEMLGVIRAVSNQTMVYEDLGWYGNIKRWVAEKLMLRALNNGTGLQFFTRFLPVPDENEGHGDPVASSSNNIDGVGIFGDTTETSTNAWQAIIAAAEEHNEPGVFTTFLGWGVVINSNWSQLTSRGGHARRCRKSQSVPTLWL